MYIGEQARKELVAHKNPAFTFVALAAPLHHSTGLLLPIHTPAGCLWLRANLLIGLQAPRQQRWGLLSTFSLDHAQGLMQERLQHGPGAPVLTSLLWVSVSMSLKQRSSIYSQSCPSLCTEAPSTAMVMTTDPKATVPERTRLS